MTFPNILQAVPLTNECPGTNKSELALYGLKMATKFGAANFLTTLVNNFPVETIPDDVKQQLLTNAVMSDCPETFRKVYAFTDAHANEEVVNIAKVRGNSDIMVVLLPNSEGITEEKKLKLKSAIKNKTANLFNLVPKSEEFTYNKKVDKLKPMLTGTQVSYDSLLHALHVPTIHVGPIEKNKRNNEWKVCPGKCQQKETCDRFRQVYKLVLEFMDDLEGINPIFKNMTLSIIGSLSEDSRVFNPDEMDLHLSLNEDLKSITEFDPVTQRLMFNSNPKPGEKISDYRKHNGEFNCQKYSEDFMKAVKEIVDRKTLQGSSFKMEPLTTDFIPCCTCMKMVYNDPQAYRCRHVPDCQVHIQCQCQDKEKCTCICCCKQFSAPSLTHSKIGAVLHLEWVEKDGSKFHLDCG